MARKISKKMNLKSKASITNTTINQGFQYLKQSVNDIRSMINVEAHKHDIVQTLTPTNAGTVQSLVLIAQGDDEGYRTGNSILLSSLFHRCAYQLHASATQSFVREIIFMDKQQISDTNVSVTDILQTASYLSPLNKGLVGRYKIIKDTTFALSSSTQTRVSKKFVSFKGKQEHVRYNGTLSTDVQRNGLYILHISNEPTNTPAVSVYNRITFYDN